MHIINEYHIYEVVLRKYRYKNSYYLNRAYGLKLKSFAGFSPFRLAAASVA